MKSAEIALQLAPGNFVWIAKCGQRQTSWSAVNHHARVERRSCGKSEATPLSSHDNRVSEHTSQPKDYLDCAGTSDTTALSNRDKRVIDHSCRPKAVSRPT